MPAKQARNCRVGDILLYKNEESRIITHIKYSPFKIKSYTLRTTDLAGENPRFDAYDGPDRVKVWGTQETLF